MFRKDSQISYYEYLKIFLNNKRNLFLVSSIIFAVAILYPIILPHIHHPSMIYHIIIHIIIFEASLFLTLVSIYSYKKTKNKKVLFTSLSFGFLLVTAFLYLLETSNILGEFHIPYIEAELPHILLMFMLILFAIGVLRVESK
ncbi:MAG: hypothetical protein L0H53_16900 [Candidatus Nitrosocosmicus sp.]|nr:hypothetical protein [Candidatus Nitrosocosmicus sp.]